MEKVSTDCCASEDRKDYTGSQTGPEKLAPDLTKSLQPFPCDSSPACHPQVATCGGW